jgi:hypothetical protein
MIARCRCGNEMEKNIFWRRICEMCGKWMEKMEQCAELKEERRRKKGLENEKGSKWKGLGV